MLRFAGRALLVAACASPGCAAQTAPVEQPASRPPTVVVDESLDSRPVAASPEPEQTAPLPPLELPSPTRCWSPAAPISVAPGAAPEQIYEDGRAHYEANRLREAAALFEHLALGFPRHEVARYAMMLHLDALNQHAAASKPHALSCGAEIERCAAQYQLLFCQAKSQHEEECSVLAAIRCAAGRGRATHAAEQQRWDEAARRFAELADLQPPCPKGDELLFNAARALQQAGRAQEAQSMLRRLQREHPQSPLRRAPISP